MNRLIAFFKNEHIQIALVTGFCIIALAVFFKKIMHYEEVPPVPSAVPALFFTGWEAARAKKTQGVLGQLWVGISVLFVSTGAIMLIYYLR